ncbi:ankyrin repeat-containing domain protein [Xylaria bambusicola]|uniref:ankyrin repeat-containing domain protein n=1 Tax=Xylaria bambusicola TaxID=326684 RepID=UPI00200765A9|nr:ankyrin repeat-containing domain protein [Xylaria bambusicola]KAI0502757.1 ankyrin repeat-containing domain protein [Xylaria bambusicola]
MPPETSISNHDSGPQNVVIGSGPQSNFNGSGTQNNYYGVFQDTQVVQANKLREEKRCCLKSLSYPSMNSRRNKIDNAHPHTCDWLFETTEFKQWRRGSNLRTHKGVLWIKGKPGAGKSTLMSHTLSHCEKVFSDHLIVAHFFNGRGDPLDTTPLGMMRSIVYQLINKDSILCEAFLELYRENQEQNGDQFQWQESELKTFLIAKQSYFRSKPLLFLVDAVDECGEEGARDVVGFLESLSVNAAHIGVELRICLSSRPYPWVSMKNNLELIVEGRHEHGMAIATYARDNLIIEDPSIEHQLRQKAGGIFMWVVLVITMLNKEYDEGRPEDMQKTLDEIPGDLEGIFETILEKVSPNRTESINMLQWVLLSKRPLMPDELYMAVIGKPLPSPETIRRRITSSSKGLIEIRKESHGEFVQFIHLSVKDFLCKNKRLEMLDPALQPDAISASHAYIWTQCWSYIQRQSTVSAGEGDARGSGVDSLLTYVATYILDHADGALSNATVASRLDHDMSHWLAARDTWVHQLVPAKDLEQRDNLYKYWLDNLTLGHEKLIYILSLFPYPNLFNFAVDKGADVNATLSNGRTLLQFALELKGYHSVHLLIRKGVDVNGPGGRAANLLLVVSRSAYEIAELLIENGVNIHAWNTPFGNALQAACYCGNSRLVQLLIEKGVDINARGGQFGSALQAASSSGHYSITELLLQSGANVNAQGGTHSHALQAAVSIGHYSIADLLLQKGANVNAQSRRYGNALQTACKIGNYSIVELLLQKGAQVNAQGGHYGNALQTACRKGNYSIVELLLQKGAQVNAQGGHYGTALQAASAAGNRRIVELLLSNSADVNALGGEYGDALHAAAYQGNDYILLLLSRYGAVHAENLVSQDGNNLCELCEQRCKQRRFLHLEFNSPYFNLKLAL